MSMFDTIIFKTSPIEDVPYLIEFQTKDLENIMDTYLIDDDNQMRLEILEYTTRDEEKEDDESIFPLLRTKHLRWDDFNYTGIIHAYTFDDNFWYDVYIQLKNGKVQEIKTHKKP